MRWVVVTDAKARSVGGGAPSTEGYSGIQEALAVGAPDDIEALYVAGPEPFHEWTSVDLIIEALKFVCRDNEFSHGGKRLDYPQTAGR
ncbi:MAG: hypothetical protein RJP95_04795 [Pirellulales bacterium]